LSGASTRLLATFPKTSGSLFREYQAQGLPDDEETILSNVRENFGPDTNEEKIVGLIQNGAGQDME
jgi:hypothetical protein